MFYDLLKNSFSQQRRNSIAYLLLDVHKRTFKDKGVWETLKPCCLSHRDTPIFVRMYEHTLPVIRDYNRRLVCPQTFVDSTMASTFVCIVLHKVVWNGSPILALPNVLVALYN